MGAVHLGDDRANFLRSKDDGEVSTLFGTEGLNIFEGLIEDFSIEEKNGVEGLILGGG
jgi:hypothetical protein